MLVRQWRAAAAPERRSLAAGVRQRRGEARARRRLRDQSGRRPAVDGVRGLRRHAVRVPRGPGARGPLRLARRAHADGAARRMRPSARTCATPWHARSATPRSSSRSGCRSSTRYVDAGGSPAELPAADDPRRTVTEIDHHGHSRRRHRARPRAGRRHRPRRRRGHRPDAGEPAPRCRAARAPGRAARLARAAGRGGRRRAPAHRARPPRRRPVAARRARAEPAPRPHEA